MQNENTTKLCVYLWDKVFITKNVTHTERDNFGQYLNDPLKNDAEIKEDII